METFSQLSLATDCLHLSHPAGTGSRGLEKKVAGCLWLCGHELRLQRRFLCLCLQTDGRVSFSSEGSFSTGLKQGISSASGQV